MNKQPYPVLSWTKRTGTLLGAVALGLSTVVLTGCNQPKEIEAGRTNTTAEEVAQVSGPDATIGQTITIRSKPTVTIGKSGFVLNTEDGKPIVVVNATGSTFVLPSRDIPIQATGKVASFVVADVEREYGVDLENDLYIKYDRQPAILAQSLAFAPTPKDLYSAPAGYFDKPIAVKGEVRDRYSPSALSLFEDGWVDDIGVLVIGFDPNNLPKGSNIQKGEQVVVTGVARRFDVNLLKKEAPNLGWSDAQIQEFATRYTNRPVIVATQVYPSALDTK